MSELKITQEKVTAAFSEANDCPKAISILTALFGKQKPDYTDYHNIKTYEDACEAIGVKPIVRLLVEDEDGHKEEVADIAHLAYIKLCTIARALNNDPDFPRFTKDEYRYTPWFYLYNQKEIDEMNEEDRNRLVLHWGGRIKAAFSIPFKSMTPKEFFDKVVEMRRCQKEYFKNKRQIDLRISKQIEREVDEEIERVQKILHDKQNPQLF